MSAPAATLPGMPSSLAKVPPHRVEPVRRDPAHVPDECPRCGADLQEVVREVHLTVVLDDGAETELTGHECGACGWCCCPEH